MAKKKEVYTAENVFDTAVEFDYAYNLLLHNFGKITDKFMNPLKANQCLAFELYAKCLILDTTKKQFPKTHELKKLFYLLPEDVRSEIKQIHNSMPIIVRNRLPLRKPKSYYKKRKIKFTPRLNYQLDKILEIANDGFVTGRYSFEFEEQLHYGLGYVMDAVKTYIIGKHPEWKYKIEPIRKIYKMK